MYKKLVEFCSKGELSFKYVKTFNMDEYVGLPRDHPESYHSFMWENFFKHIDIDPSNAHVLDGNAPDLVKECDDYERKITGAGGVDLFIGGTYISTVGWQMVPTKLHVSETFHLILKSRNGICDESRSLVFVSFLESLIFELFAVKY